MAKLAEAEARIASATGRAAKPAAATPTVRETPAPRRRPRGSSELERKSQWAFDTFGILTANKALLRMLDDVAKLAKTNSPILVLGESGTGKELVATAVHHISGRTGSFLPINCSSLPREVIESELFGHAQGAFTGAARDKAGLLEVCAGGTAFLDEIGEMPIELQSRLLRFLETGELRRVGATRNIRVDTRIVAATNREQERHGARRGLPPGSLLPPRACGPGVAAAAAAWRRHRVARASLPRVRMRRAGEGRNAERRSASSAARTSMAGERARAEVRDEARRDPRARAITSSPFRISLSRRQTRR